MQPAPLRRGLAPRANEFIHGACTGRAPSSNRNTASVQLNSQFCHASARPFRHPSTTRLGTATSSSSPSVSTYVTGLATVSVSIFARQIRCLDRRLTDASCWQRRPCRFPPNSYPRQSIISWTAPTRAGVRTGHDDTGSRPLGDPRRVDWTASDHAKRRGDVGRRSS